MQSVGSKKQSFKANIAEEASRQWLGNHPPGQNPEDQDFEENKATGKADQVLGSTALPPEHRQDVPVDATDGRDRSSSS